MPGQDDIDRSIAAIETELAALNAKRAALLARLRALRREKISPTQKGGQLALTLRAPVVTNHSSEAEKIALFSTLFKGREDVYPRRFQSAKTGRSGYSPACGNEWVPGICQKPRIKCADCQHQAFLPADGAMLRKHLLGRDLNKASSEDFTAGVYPLLPDERCWFLAADFDKSSWWEEASAFLESCQMHNVPAALERSRSGNGGHVWIFFTEPVPAKLARRLGTFLLTRTMERYAGIGFDAYDRLFPSQDTMPQGGFGNLIALPLQKRPRADGNSVFVDEAGQPYEDQWSFLSSIRRLEPGEVEAILADASGEESILGVKRVELAEDAPWDLPPSGTPKEGPLPGPLPATLTLVLGNQLYIAKEDLTPPLRNRLVRLAAFQNPEFYRAQALRFSTHDKPRIISCAEKFPQHIGLPRGCLDEVVDLLVRHNIKPEIRDERFPGQPLQVQFQGELRPDQQQAAAALLQHEAGVLAATTGFGKTVIAAYLIAQRQTNTLVLVHRRQLLDQWLAQLTSFLGLAPEAIGQIGSGKRNPTGIVDVATIQSLHRKGVVDDIVGGYGHLIIDECHHISARSFELVARQCKAKYILGLSATVTRKDGHHPIIFMQCGPVRYRVDPKQQAAKRAFQHYVLIRKTAFRLEEELEPANRPSIQAIYGALAGDEVRNALIVADVLAAVRAGRHPVVLTERRDHLQHLAERLQPHLAHLIILRGGMGKKQRRRVQEQLDSAADGEPLVILATGRYLGEGFDEARLDTLFLTLPISWRGTLVQYAGRLHRDYHGKQEVIIYDYLDEHVPMLHKMYSKRSRGYATLGYELKGCQDDEAEKDNPEEIGEITGKGDQRHLQLASS
ncbi:MAG: DEAD/DEAH box helicase [Anaerolineales bacterium]|nr:DEAD/DEAH box helicase [Anaerolineales bacterium]